MASTALHPCPRDHRAQSLYLQMRKLMTPGCAGTRPGPASLPPHQHALASAANFCLLPEPTGPPNPSPGPFCLTSLEYQAKPGQPGFSHTRLASPSPTVQRVILKLMSDHVRHSTALLSDPCSKLGPTDDPQSGRFFM